MAKFEWALKEEGKKTIEILLESTDKRPSLEYFYVTTRVKINKFMHVMNSSGKVSFA